MQFAVGLPEYMDRMAEWEQHKLIYLGLDLRKDQILFDELLKQRVAEYGGILLTPTQIIVHNAASEDEESNGTVYPMTDEHLKEIVHKNMEKPIYIAGGVLSKGLKNMHFTRLARTQMSINADLVKHIVVTLADQDFFHNIHNGHHYL